MSTTACSASTALSSDNDQATPAVPLGAPRANDVYGKRYMRQPKELRNEQPVPRRRTRKRISTEVLPLPRNGEFYTLEELGELTDHLVKMHRHYPAANPHWKPVKRQLRSSLERVYRKWRVGPPRELWSGEVLSAKRRTKRSKS